MPCFARYRSARASCFAAGILESACAQRRVVQGIAILIHLPVRLVELLHERGIRTVDVPDDEFESMGPNVLALEPGVVIALERNRETQRRLERLGVEVLTYEGTELSKGDGGPGCLTRPLLRS